MKSSGRNTDQAKGSGLRVQGSPGPASLSPETLTEHPSILVIGYGNPLRGDDGAGWWLTERLAKAICAPSVCILTCHQLTLDLAEPISGAQLVIFLDASCDDSPGQVCQRDLLPETSSEAATSHSLSPEALLGCARILYAHAPRALLFTIGGQRFDYHEGLSPIVQQACVELIPRVAELIQSRMAVP